MRDVMASLSTAGGKIGHPLLQVREPVRIGVLSITADRGLAGSYPTNILRKTVETMRPFEQESIQMLVVGRKGHTFFRRRGYRIAAEYALNVTGATFGEAQEISRKAQEMYISGEIDVLYLVYTKFLSALAQRPTVIQVLPIVTETADTEPVEEGLIAQDDYIFEPGAAQILGRLLPKYVDTLIYQALLESVASEHGARMTAMSSATDNAGKMIDTLTLSLNRARQANITKEIAEIVGGADAQRN